MPKFDFQSFLEYHKKYQITVLFSVPAIYLLIAKSPLVTDHFNDLKLAQSGAAPLSVEVQKAASAKLGRGQTFIGQTWGLSETTGSVTCMPWIQKDETGSVGPLLPNLSMRSVGTISSTVFLATKMKCRIVNDAMNDVEPGKSGEILIKGPVVSKGYYNNPEATVASLKDGWLCTGDIGIMRNELLYIVDRKKVGTEYFRIFV
jgi:4-coumarate--CoA ligase